MLLHRNSLYVALSCALGAALLMTGCQQEANSSGAGAPAVAQQMPPAQVKVVTVKPAPTPIQTELSGRTSATMSLMFARRSTAFSRSAFLQKVRKLKLANRSIRLILQSMRRSSRALRPHLHRHARRLVKLVLMRSALLSCSRSKLFPSSLTMLLRLLTRRL